LSQVSAKATPCELLLDASAQVCGVASSFVSYQDLPLGPILLAADSLGNKGE